MINAFHIKALMNIKLVKSLHEHAISIFSTRTKDTNTYIVFENSNLLEVKIGGVVFFFGQGVYCMIKLICYELLFVREKI